MPPDDLPCRDAVQLVTDYLEGALPAGRRAVVEHHLSICEGCTTYFDQLRRTIALVGSLRAEDVPEPVLGAVTAAFRELRGR